MSDNLGSLTTGTKEKVARMCFSVREAHGLFLDCYRAGLTDVAGAAWEKEWKTWEQSKLSHVVRRLHAELKVACLEAGMSPSVFKRYQRAGLNAVFIGIPFSFGTTITAGEIGEVQQLKTAFKGTEEERTVAACKELQKRRNQTTARSLLKSRTILPEPGESGNLFGDLVNSLALYLERSDVRKEVRGYDLLRVLRKRLKAVPVAAG